MQRLTLKIRGILSYIHLIHSFSTAEEYAGEETFSQSRWKVTKDDDVDEAKGAYPEHRRVGIIGGKRRHVLGTGDRWQPGGRCPRPQRRRCCKRCGIGGKHFHRL